MIPEGDAVCIAFSNIRGSTFSAIALGDCRTLLDLDERAVCMESKIGCALLTPNIKSILQNHLQKGYSPILAQPSNSVRHP